MGRLTTKIDKKAEIPGKRWSHPLIFYTYKCEKETTIAVANKLGKIEDLMDEYNIHSVEELSQVLEEHCKNGEILYFCERCGCQSLRESDSYCPECGGKVEK